MLYVIRHGQTDINKQGRLQGRRGLPLNEAGMKQAEDLKQQLSHITFDYVFSSPQERAIQTAEISTGMSCLIDSRLDVYDLGEADGLLKGEVKMAGPLPDSSYYNDVEDPEQYMQRILHFMRELQSHHGVENKQILISGHRCTTGAIGAFFNGIPQDKNILKNSSNNGECKLYDFTNINRRTKEKL
ncbi:histidine phosphatase family protein [Rossellomorea aquimaris]|uniref:histidine phosphatase family protein n=1 Tax=Rossellomorea aquimaris TaxID=189382 RepID=UPI001CD490CA|nr:histidine phosphatase family protein [Rossellomorea aquimaris]MCA1058826.1 histidine phosphatase family protein [Rossellomorea aquimaris]